MIVGGYSLFLYCRSGSVGSHDGCKGPQSFVLGQSRHEFTGATEAQCKRAARKSGWTFHRDGDVSCPWCSGNRET